MVTPKQIGCMECGLYAIAISTSIAFGKDPSQHIFNQDDMHHQKCLSNQVMKPFPVKKRKRVNDPIINTFCIYLCPICAQPDNGNTIVQCKSCSKHHNLCVPRYDTKNAWYCHVCLNNNNSKDTKN